jgi:futalosine hydrolase
VCRMRNPDRRCADEARAYPLPVILLVAATNEELAALAGTRAITSGLGPVDAALATQAALADGTPRAVLHVGIAGARRTSGLQLLDVVIGSESHYSDHRLRTLPPPVERAHPGLVAAARRALPSAHVLPIATSARVGGGDSGVEAMEGYGVLRAAARAGVPAVEVRVISNEVEEDDRSRWRFAEAFAVLQSILPDLVREVSTCVS